MKEINLRVCVVMVLSLLLYGNKAYTLKERDWSIIQIAESI
jgi:hypothetical protein